MDFDSPKVGSGTEVISPRGLNVKVERDDASPLSGGESPSLEEHEQRYKAGEEGEHALKPTDLIELNTIGLDEKVATSLTSPRVKYVETPHHPIAEAAKIMETKLDDFDYSISVVIDALNEVAKIHPFVAAAVIAFGAVYKLESTRRENDSKVKLLYVEMKEMMRVLLRLRTMKHIESDRQSRLEVLSKATAVDIKDGANACETYLKKRLIVKFVKSPVWEKRFADLFKKYYDRRREFEFELTIRSSVVGDEVLTKVSHVHDGQTELLHNVRMMAAIFEKALSPDQVKLKKLVMDKCGPGGVRDEAQLKQLLKERPILVEDESRAGAPPKYTKAKDEKTNVDEVLKELKDTANDTYLDEVKNMEYFERKFVMQSAQIISSMEDIVVRESDRVITAVVSGPQDRILDKDMHTLWKDMRWGGHVKANHFILALRDFYQQKVETRKLASKSGESPEPEPDEWAYRHINLPFLQHLLEAIDDDASGFVTISELNTFTSSRPKGWSLPHWLAYWAVGWFRTIVEEKGRILSIFDKMHGLIPKLLPENQPYAIQYLQLVWRKVTEYVYSLNDIDAPSNIEGKFKTYVEAEEKRLRIMLEEIKYNIKDMESFYLITGPDSIEKHFFPLTRLILERHLELFRLCKSRVINDYELRDAADTIEWAYDAIWYRHRDLKVLFKSQRRDLEVEFGTYAFGLYEYINKPSLIWAKRFKTMKFEDDDDDSSSSSDSDSEVDDEDGSEEGDGSNVRTEVKTGEKGDNMPEVNSSAKEKSQKPEDILCHPEPIIDYPPYEDPDCAGYDGEARIVSADPMSGTWNGLFYNSKDSVNSYCPMMPFTAAADPTEEQPLQFRMTGISFRGWTYTCSGTCIKTKKRSTFDIKFRYWQDNLPNSIIYHVGQLDVLAGSVSGTWGDEEDASDHKGIFVMKRTPAQILRLRPAPSIISKNKTKALWDYAIQAVLYQIRKQQWSWSFFRERRDLRQQYLALALRTSGLGHPCSSEEKKEFAKLRQLLSHFDARFYHQLRLLKERPLATKSEFECDGCEKDIILRFPGRIKCLDCEPDDGFYSSVDLCLDMDCLKKPLNDSRDGLEEPHLPSHRLLLLRREQLFRNQVKEAKMAKQAISKGEKLFKATLTGGDSESDSFDSSEISSGGSNDTPVETQSSDEVIDEAVDETTDESTGEGADDATDGATDASGKRSSQCSDHSKAESITENKADKASVAGKSEHEEGLKCGVCEEGLQRPCWYCMDCTDEDVFVCLSCNEKGGTTLKKYGHDQFHSLVMIRDEDESDDDDISLETRVDGLQDKIESVEQHVQEIKERQGSVEDHFREVKERQSRVEEQIQALIDRQTRIEDMLTRLCDALGK